MQSSSAIYSAGTQAAARNYYYASQDRSDRFRSFASEVVPSLVQQAAVSEGFTAATTATSAAGRTATTSTAGAAAGTVGSYLATGMTWLAGAQGLYDIAKNWGKSSPAQGAMSGMAAGAAIGSVIPGVGTVIGAAVGTVVGGLVGFIRSGKHKDQLARDQVRGALKDAGIIDENYGIRLADGSTFDIGKDGGPKAELGGRRPYEVDFNNPLAGYAVSWMNPAISLLTGGDPKLTSDFVGYFANAATSNAKSLDDVRANVNVILAQLGLSDEALAGGIQDQVTKGVINQGVGAAYMNGIIERRQVGDDLQLAAAR